MSFNWFPFSTIHFSCYCQNNVFITHHLCLLHKSFQWLRLALKIQSYYQILKSIHVPLWAHLPSFYSSLTAAVILASHWVCLPCLCPRLLISHLKLNTAFPSPKLAPVFTLSESWNSHPCSCLAETGEVILEPFFTSYPMSSASVSLVGSTCKLHFCQIIHHHLLCHDTSLRCPHPFPSLASTQWGRTVLTALCASSLGSPPCILCAAAEQSWSMSYQWHLTHVPQAFQWLFLITRMKPQLLVMAYKAAHSLQPYVFQLFSKLQPQGPSFCS